jgi:hypothetical protein
MPKATTVRFTDELYQRLDQASARTGLPVNSIVIAACLEWMQRHTPESAPEAPAGAWTASLSSSPVAMVPPRWATLSRAVKLAMARQERPGTYPFDRFSDNAKQMLTVAQAEAQKAGFSYIGTEHLLLAAFRPEFHSAKVLAALGVREADVRSAVETMIGRAKTGHFGGIMPTSRVKRVIEIAFQLCGSMNHPRVGTNHVLLALAVEGEGIAARVLSDLGVTMLKIEAEVRNLPEPEL